MDERGKISGQKITELFQTLKTKNILLTLRIAGKDYERLTMINDVKADAEGDLFIIDPPRGFDVVTKNLDPWKFHFQFNGPDRLEYRFSTVGGGLTGKDICIPFPEFVERIQRRRYFRMETPMGCRFNFSLNKTELEIGLVNISEGGCFGVPARMKKKAAAEMPAFKIGDAVHRIELFLPSDDENVADQTVEVKKATVRRIEQDAEKGLWKYAFEFTDISQKERSKLTRYIYHLQRLFLRRR